MADSWKIFLRKTLSFGSIPPSELIDGTESIAPLLTTLRPLPVTQPKTELIDTGQLRRSRTDAAPIREAVNANTDETEPDECATYLGRRLVQSNDVAATGGTQHRRKRLVLASLLGLAVLGTALGTGLWLAHAISQPSALKPVHLDKRCGYLAAYASSRHGMLWERTIRCWKDRSA